MNGLLININFIQPSGKNLRVEFKWILAFTEFQRQNYAILKFQFKWGGDYSNEKMV